MIKLSKKKVSWILAFFKNFELETLTRNGKYLIKMSMNYVRKIDHLQKIWIYHFEKNAWHTLHKLFFQRQKKKKIFSPFQKKVCKTAIYHFYHFSLFFYQFRTRIYHFFIILFSLVILKLFLKYVIFIFTKKPYFGDFLE